MSRSENMLVHRAGRRTEKWLHDDWLQKNDIMFIKR